MTCDASDTCTRQHTCWKMSLMLYAANASCGSQHHMRALTADPYKIQVQSLLKSGQQTLKTRRIFQFAALHSTHSIHPIANPGDTSAVTIPEVDAVTATPMMLASHLICWEHRAGQRHWQHIWPRRLLLSRADLATDQSRKLWQAQQLLYHLTPAV